MAPRPNTVRVLVVAVIMAVAVAAMVVPTTSTNVATAERKSACTIPHCKPCGGNRRGRCVRGTTCAKNNKGALSCVKPMAAGQKCTDPCWTCARGLRCGARGTCEAIPPPAIPHCKPCGGNRRGRCVRGTTCAKNNKGALSCVKPMAAGQKCTDPCWTCARGLRCGTRGVCEQLY